MKSGLFFIGGIITGAAVGAGVALLFAPKKGSETRDLLKVKMHEMEIELEKVRDKLKEKGGELKDELITRMHDIEGKIEKLLEDYKSTLEPSHGAN